MDSITSPALLGEAMQQVPTMQDYWSKGSECSFTADR